MSLSPLTGASTLRTLLSNPKNLVVCPGVFDGLTARIALAANFQAIYMVLFPPLSPSPSRADIGLQTGAGTSLSRLGLPDLGLATQDLMITQATTLASLSPSTPLIADADTGYGGPLSVTRTVAAYARAGVAALHIEDQATEKRCGHLAGKVIVEREIYYSRLRAAVMARDGVGSEMMIFARTDARQSLGFEEASERLTYAVQEIGVDGVFLEGLETKEEAREICRRFEGKNTPVLLNMVTGGVTPTITAEEAREMGFRVMIFPGACIDPVIRGVEAELKYLKDNGVVSDEFNAYGVKRWFNLCGLQECIEIDRRAGGKAYDSVGE